MERKKIHTLSAIVQRINELFTEKFHDKYFWMKAELSNVSTDRKGNCYIDLIESKEQVLLAKARASIWSSRVHEIQQKLGEHYDKIVKNGSEALLLVSASFSNIYGIQFNIHDVDLNFSMGELERKKQENIDFLRKNQLLGLNQRTTLPLVVQNIALIGSPNTAGHEDLLKQIGKNLFNYQFQIDIYPCLVQGDQAPKDIIQQFEKVRDKQYDAVILIRGGGSKFDLEAFNDLELSICIANFPLPVLTGIGHETDWSVVDMVANRNFKTPSAVGAFIVERAQAFWNSVYTTFDNIQFHYRKNLRKQADILERQQLTVVNLAVQITQARLAELHSKTNRITHVVRTKLAGQRSFLETAKQHITLSPANIYRRERAALTQHADTIAYFARLRIKVEKTDLESTIANLKLYAKASIKKNQVAIQNFEDIPKLFDPRNISKKGFAIVRKDGKILSKDTPIEDNDLLSVELYDKKLVVIYKKEHNPWNS